jgi:hypothetical protein
MKTLIILAVLLTTGCGIDGGELTGSFIKACNVPVSADLTIMSFGTKLVVHCAEVSDD